MVDDKPVHKKIDVSKLPNPKYYPKGLLEYNKMNPTVSFKLNADQKLRLMNKAIEKNTTMANYCKNIVIRYGLGDMSFKDVPEIREERNESYTNGYRDGYNMGRSSHMLISALIVVLLMVCTAIIQMRSPFDMTLIYYIYTLTESVLLGAALYYMVRK